MLFQTYYRLDPWGFEPPLKAFDVIQFDDPKRMFSLYIRYKRSFNEEDEAQVLIQTIHRRDDIPDSALAVFAEDLNSNSTLNPKSNKDAFVNYEKFVVELHKYMDKMTSEIFDVVRWRMGVVGGPLSLQSDWGFMRWHDERESKNIFDKYGFLNRQIINGESMIGIPDMQFVDFGEKCKSDIKNLISLQAQQPLYHDLFREAWQNQLSNPRSALVMGVAAAETGFKTTLTDLNPSMSWIVENVSSPPLVRMLREYMEQLPARNLINGQVLRPPSSLIDTIRKGVELRNKLVHGREEVVAAEEVRLILEAVRDLLYMLDYYRGHDWAMDRLSPEILEYLKSKKDN
jgi:hypothetical protein